MLASSVDWNAVLLYGVPSYIAALGGAIAAVYAARVHVQAQTPSGKPLGEVVEYAHDTAIANNLLLKAANGDTEPISKETLREESSTPPSAPSNGHPHPDGAT